MDASQVLDSNAIDAILNEIEDNEKNQNKTVHLNKPEYSELPLGWAKLKDDKGFYYFNVITAEKERNIPTFDAAQSFNKSLHGETKTLQTWNVNNILFILNNFVSDNEINKYKNRIASYIKDNSISGKKLLEVTRSKFGQNVIQYFDTFDYLKMNMAAINVYDKLVQFDNNNTLNALSTQTREAKEEEKGNVSDYDGYYTSKYEQFKIDFNWFYGTFSEALLIHLKELTKTKSTLNIVDIACGDGNISQLIIDSMSYLNKDNITIIGIDISSSQIDLAKLKSASNINYINSINYEVGTAQNIRYENHFDVAISLWPFGYSTNIKVLTEMMNSCYKSLKPGGVCIGATTTMPNPKILSKYHDFHKNKFCIQFGDNINLIQNVSDGKILSQTMFNDMTFIEYFYYPDTYNKIAKQVGFTDGIKFIDSNSLTLYDTVATKLNAKEQDMATEFFNNPHPFRMFILRK